MVRAWVVTGEESWLGASGTLAARLGIRPAVTAYAFDQAPDALRDLESGDVTGAAVLALDNP
jgi:D-arabinose 1-dehydrogenase-like Zn-dependent alcohol dehydrogenase